MDFWGPDGPGGPRNYSKRRGPSCPVHGAGPWPVLNIDFRVPPGWRVPAPKTPRVGELPPPRSLSQGDGGRQPPNPRGLGGGSLQHIYIYILVSWPKARCVQYPASRAWMQLPILASCCFRRVRTERAPFDVHAGARERGCDGMRGRDRFGRDVHVA